MDQEKLARLDAITLLKGAHATRDAGMCAMEAVAWLAGEHHSDAPRCACPVIARAVIRLNDRISDDDVRTKLLRPLVPKIIGTRSTREVQVRRIFVAADMAVRVFAPLAFEKFGRLDLAASLRVLTEITDKFTARAGRDAARVADDAAYAATNDANDANDAAAAATIAADAAYDAATADAAANAADAAYDAATADAAANAAATASAAADYSLVVEMIERMIAVT